MKVADAFRCATRNREALAGCKLAACYYCRKKFDPATIVEWTDHELTAICPLCGIDSVIPGDGVTRAFLRDCYQHWFHRSYMLAKDGKLTRIK